MVLLVYIDGGGGFMGLLAAACQAFIPLVVRLIISFQSHNLEGDGSFIKKKPPLPHKITDIYPSKY